MPCLDSAHTTAEEPTSSPTTSRSGSSGSRKSRACRGLRSPAAWRPIATPYGDDLPRISAVSRPAPTGSCTVPGRCPAPTRRGTRFRAGICGPGPVSLALEGKVGPLEQPQRLGLLLVCPSLGGPGLRRTLRTPGLTIGRGSRSRVSRILRCVFPFGSRPFDHRRDLLRQPGEVPVIERFDVRVRRGLLHPDGGPASLEQPQRLGLLLVCPSLGGPGLRRMHTTTFRSSG